jgi:hypothetical protein
MNFRIPDFPLGALLVLGLFGVGFVFAFPDDSYIWLWQIAVVIAVLLWVIGAGFLAGLLRDDIEKRPQGNKEGDKASQEQTKSHTSSPISGLIEAINAHSRANIAEESKEDYERSLRERITIVLLAITMVAIIFQVIEMRKVYGPIKDQANAALGQAKAALAQIYVISANMRFEDFGIDFLPKGRLPPQNIIGWMVTPHWNNAGGTDATNLLSRWSLFVRPNNQSRPFEQRLKDPCPSLVPEEKPLGGITLSPGSTHLQISADISIVDLLRAMNGLEDIYMVGIPEYDDIFPEHSDSRC